MLINYRILLVIIVILCGNELYSQDFVQRKGYVTYISSQNVYVRFDDTRGIIPGDTLYFNETGILKPVVLVKFISSRSTAGELLNSYQVKLNQELTALLPVPELMDSIVTPPLNKAAGISVPDDKLPGKQIENDSPEELNEKYSGRFSVQSYSNFSNSGSAYDLQRWRYSLSFNGKNISGSPLSFTSYINFSYRTGEWQKVQSHIGRNLRVYDLALNYKTGDNLNLWLGRYLNRRISGISSVDGLQAEQQLSNFYVGGIVGSRPGFTDMGFNLKLFEFGGYAGRTDSLKNGLMENTLALFQQTNDFNTDRRFMYFQHNNNNLIPNTSIFFSTEADLFKKVRSVSENDFSLTGIFASLRYSPLKEASASLSYDARKNVIYYETFRNFTDSLIENETRQGLRGNLNFRPLKNLFISTGAGWRYRKGDVKPSRNFNGNITYSAVPLVINSATMSYHKIISSYLEGTVLGAGVYKNIPAVNMDLGLNYRNTTYTFSSGTDKQVQNSFTIDLSSRITRQLYFLVSYEGLFENKRTISRILLDLTARM